MAFVAVEFDYEYKAKDGRRISIKPNERYILISKTNDHWWQVCKDKDSKPFYVPAEYVKEVSVPSGDSSVPKKPESSKSLKTSPDTKTVTRLRSESKETIRFSTFGLWVNLQSEDAPAARNRAHSLNDIQKEMSPNSSRRASAAPQADISEDIELYAKPRPAEKKMKQAKISKGDKSREEPQGCVEDKPVDLPPPIMDDMDFPLPPPDFYDTPPEISVEDKNLRTAVYVNVAQLRQSISESPPSDPSPCSGQKYYFHPDTGRTTWDKPFLDSPTDPERLPPEVPCSPSPPPSDWGSDWEQLVDETTGRPYFYNHMSGETSWDPPEQQSPYPPPMEPMKDYPGAETAEAYEDLNNTGPPTLPKEYSLSHVSRTNIPRANLDRSTPPGWNLTVEPNGTWVFTSENSPDQWIKSVDDQGQTYYYLRDGSKSEWNLPEVKILLYFKDMFSKLTGILNKTKVCENGKKVRKNWAPTWTVLHGGVLTFHKDPKPSPGANRTNQIVPEFTVDLKGATIGWATKDKSSKKNVLELKGKNGVEFLIQYDIESIIFDWHKVLTDTIRQLDHPSEEEDGDLYEKIVERDIKPSVSQSPSAAGETDPKKVRTKLMKFLMKRPTLQSVKEKGYFRENVFGCHLATLCAQERATVPSFVEKCVKAVERRGLDIDGLYRVSGNLAVIQKLRFKADHEELDLEDGQWEDVHVITGALKLFFRELPEPLFPYSHFNSFIAAIRIADYNTKLSHIFELVRSLPPANHDTMKLLFGHLQRVIQYGESNRMTVQNVAIVFGPTLLRPETETANITMHMVFQNQIVEFILNEYNRLFS
uniref:Rho GTPase activating protein 27 n=1 Tax=Cyprinodon variegatus TaxID=28743 RepID=A0A3Q2CML6_CYPVA